MHVIYYKYKYTHGLNQPMIDVCTLYNEHAVTLYPLPCALLLFNHFSLCVCVYFHNCSSSRIQFICYECFAFDDCTDTSFKHATLNTIMYTLRSGMCQLCEHPISCSDSGRHISIKNKPKKDEFLDPF